VGKYRVFGYFNHQYMTIVNANSESEAYDIAENQTTDKWSMVDTDVNIYPHEVYLEDDLYDPKAVAREFYRNKDGLEITSTPETIS
jgi:hypothetical protein